MSDPISLITLGAAVGGVAGKLAERAWDSATGWLGDRFAHHTESAIKAARENTEQFVIELANRVQALEHDNRVDAEAAEIRESHPQFALLLQAAVLAGAQTDSKEKHQILADLVAARLTANADTTLALASEMACQAISRATTRQLMLLALCAFLEDIRPRELIDKQSYGVWIDTILDPFVDLEFHEIDALHLTAINCITYDPTSKKDLILLLNMKVRANALLRNNFEESENLFFLEMIWGQGLLGVQLTSVGKLIGGLVFDRLFGISTGMPEWA